MLGRQIARRTRCPVIGALAIERGYFIHESRRIALAAGQTTSRGLQLFAQFLGSSVDGRFDVDAPRAMGIGTSRADCQLRAVKHNGRAGLIGAFGIRPHQYSLFAP